MSENVYYIPGDAQVISFAIHNPGAPNIMCCMEGCLNVASWGIVQQIGNGTYMLGPLCQGHLKRVDEQHAEGGSRRE